MQVPGWIEHFAQWGFISMYETWSGGGCQRQVREAEQRIASQQRVHEQQRGNLVLAKSRNNPCSKKAAESVISISSPTKTVDLGAQLSEPSLETTWASRGVIWEWEGPRKTCWLAELSPGSLDISNLLLRLLHSPFGAQVGFILLSLQRGLWEALSSGDKFTAALLPILCLHFEPVSLNITCW